MLGLSALAMSPMRSTAQPGGPSIPVRTLNHVHLNVSDLRRSVEFYQALFGMRLQGNQGVEADWSRGVVPILRIGDGPHFISFAQSADPGPRGRIDHLGFGVERFDLNHVHLPVTDVPRSRAFYERVLGMQVQAEQGIESDWTTPIIFMLGIGSGPAFISFSPGGRTGLIDHFCFGMEQFDAERVAEALEAYGLEPNIRMRADSDPPVPELKFTDPDGIIVQIQDVSYCGGSGVLGNMCAV